MAELISTNAVDSANSDSNEQAAPKQVAAAQPAKYGWWWGTGRRKAAVARVRIRPGEGKFLINKKEINDFFSEDRDRSDSVAPLKATNTMTSFDVFVNVRGGGYTGQSGAILLGLARAIKTYDPSLEEILRKNNFLSRDPRRVERKKYGQPGARKRFQFSKR